MSLPMHSHTHTRTHTHVRCCLEAGSLPAVSQGPGEVLGPRCVRSEATLLFRCDNSHPQSRWPNLDMVRAVRFLTVPHLQGRVKTVEPNGRNTGTEISRPPFPCVCYVLSP